MKDVIHILVTLPITEQQVDRLNSISDRLLITVHPSAKAEEIPVEIWQPTNILFAFDVLPDPAHVPDLAWLQYYAAGVDRLMQTPLAQNENLKITTLSGANASGVAEHAISLLLSLGRNLPYLYDFQIRNKWLSKRMDFQPRSIRGSTVGIVGYGSVGREIARLLRPFGVKLLVSKKNAMQLTDKGYTPEGMGDPDGEMFDRLYPPEALRSMLRECDFVIVATPAIAETQGLISEEILAALKPTAYLIDVSRGGVVDHQALIVALQEERLAGAGLDVFPEEPLDANSGLWEMPNVIVTPHVAGASPRYMDNAIDLFSINLRRHLNGETLLNLVDHVKGY